MQLVSFLIIILFINLFQSVTASAQNQYCIQVEQLGTCKSLPADILKHSWSVNDKFIDLSINNEKTRRSKCKSLFEKDFYEETYTVSYGCFGEKALHIGRNIFILSSMSYVDEGWAGLLDAVFPDSLVVSASIGETNLCKIYVKPSTLKGNYGCKATKTLSLAEIAPEVAHELNSVHDKQAQQKDRLQNLLPDYYTKKSNYEKLAACYTDIATKSVDDTPTEACGVTDVQAALKDGKKALDTLRSEIATEQAKIKQRYDDIASIVRKELTEMNADPENLAIYKDAIGDVQIPDFTLPPLPDAPKYDPANDVYGKQAEVTATNLEKAIENNDRFAFLIVAESWLNYTKTVFNLIEKRAVLIEGEMEAFLLAADKVEKVLAKNIDLAALKEGDVWFNDSPIPPSFRNAVKNEIAPNDPQTAREIQKSVILWKGHELTPAQAAVMTLLEVSAKAIVNLPKTMDSMQKSVDAKLKSIVSSAKAAAIEVGKFGVSLSPAGDYMDFYEAVIGRECCSLTNPELSIMSRVLSGAGIVIGSGKFWRTVASEAKVVKRAEQFEEVILKAEGLVDSAGKAGIKTAEDMSNFGGLLKAGKVDNVDSFLSTAVRATDGSPILFTADEAVQHFKKHNEKIMKSLGKTSYDLKEYMTDAHHVMREGTYVAELNAYVKLMGGTGRAKAAFVGLDRGGKRITTFHVRYASDIANEAPSLGWTIYKVSVQPPPQILEKLKNHVIYK